MRRVLLGLFCEFSAVAQKFGYGWYHMPTAPAQCIPKPMALAQTLCPRSFSANSGLRPLPACGGNLHPHGGGASRMPLGF